MNDGCTNNDDYPAAWTSDNLKGKMFHDTFDACCNAIFNPDGNNANFSCEKYDVICHDDDGGGGGGPTPVSSPDSGSNECKYGWHVNRATNAGCTNNEEVVEGWLAPALLDKMFFSRLEDCCLTFFPNSKGDETLYR